MLFLFRINQESTLSERIPVATISGLRNQDVLLSLYGFSLELPATTGTPSDKPLGKCSSLWGYTCCGQVSILPGPRTYEQKGARVARVVERKSFHDALREKSSP